MDSPESRATDGLVREVNRRLSNHYNPTRLGNKDDPLDELVFIILSGKTQESTYADTFDRLQRRFQSWDAAEQAGQEAIEAVIHRAGLSRKKSRAIAALLSAVREKTGAVNLSFLHDMDDQIAYAFLVQLPGVGPKTAKCVLAYSLGRPAFAVDAHISRIVRRLGWSRHHRLTDRVHERIEDMIPPEYRLSLHVNLVLHGRATCTERAPNCSNCVLADLCPSAFQIH